MTKFLASSCAIIVLTFMATIAYAAPVSTILRNVLPETDSTYELGTSSRAWLFLYTDNLCLAGDCRSSWPTGGGGSGGGNVSTSSVPIIGQLAYWTTTTDTPALLSTVATGTVSGTNGITVTAGRAAVGGALAIDCTAAGAGATGCLSSADWTLFNNKVSSSSLDSYVPYTGATADVQLGENNSFRMG